MDSRFCTRCRALLRPDNTCPNCDGTPSPQKGSGFDVKELGMGVFDCAKAFFSKEPHKAVDAVTNSHFMWIVFGVVNVIFSALATSVVFSNGVDWAVNKLTGLDSAMISNFLPENINDSGLGIFFFSLLSMAGCLAAFAGIQYLFSVLEGRRLPLIVLVGMLGSITMLNDYAKRTTGEMSFWGRVFCNAAQIVAAAAILGISVSV